MREDNNDHDAQESHWDTDHWSVAVAWQYIRNDLNNPDMIEVRIRRAHAGFYSVTVVVPTEQEDRG